MDKKRDLTLLDTIRELMHRDPFQPFRLVTSSGDKYVVKNPYNMAIGESQISYFYPRSDKFVFIRVNQLVAVEQSNGRAA
jgi:hypothetical protein